MASRVRFRTLTVIDLFTRECLAIDVGRPQRPERRRNAGAAALRARVAAAHLLRNGTEFVTAAMDLWAYTNKVILDFSRLGKPTDNATIESFNGRFREECLNVHWFASIEDAEQKIDAFRWDYTENHLTVLSRGSAPMNTPGER
jgi:transposase InsO family protein